MVRDLYHDRMTCMYTMIYTVLGQPNCAAFEEKCNRKDLKRPGT